MTSPDTPEPERTRYWDSPEFNPPPERPAGNRRVLAAVVAALILATVGGSLLSVGMADTGPFATPEDPFAVAGETFRAAAPSATNNCCAETVTITLGDEGDDTVRPHGARALGRLLSDLGFSPSVLDRMGSTRALDGTQTAEGNLATAYWNYHPDNGLRVIFERK